MMKTEVTTLFVQFTLKSWDRQTDRNELAN